MQLPEKREGEPYQTMKGPGFSEKLETVDYQNITFLHGFQRRKESPILCMSRHVSINAPFLKITPPIILEQDALVRI